MQPLALQNHLDFLTNNEGRISLNLSIIKLTQITSPTGKQEQLQIQLQGNR